MIGLTNDTPHTRTTQQATRISLHPPSTDRTSFNSSSTPPKQQHFCLAWKGKLYICEAFMHVPGGKLWPEEVEPSRCFVLPTRNSNSKTLRFHQCDDSRIGLREIFAVLDPSATFANPLGHTRTCYPIWGDGLWMWMQSGNWNNWKLE